MRTSLSAAFLALALAGLAGCGGGGTSVTGEFVNDASKSSAGDKWVIQLSADGKSYSGDVADGKFTIANVANGTYKVSTTHYSAAGPKGPTPPATKEYTESWTVPGGPYKLVTSKLKK